ncbi:hypothetical protein FPHYL_11117 [Fusarium phyllophilum]|uniref:Uncharacterized protein n=1 Tax=Fusarium phyllophilum TaxID=47803 RepID=A0A8H5IY02_9HYPO|nr:hypothetical protein FPHYL_11117 [Fusarium phyllophilum]
MDTSMSTGSWESADYLVAIEVQGQKVFHVELAKIRKYPQLYAQVRCHLPVSFHAPASIYYGPYAHVYNGKVYPYYRNASYRLILHTLSQDVGHMLWEYLSFGTFTCVQGNPSEKRQEEYFKNLFNVLYVADYFSMEDFKSDCAKEIFRKAQDMSLMELVKLLEEANYRSDMFPKFSVYLEKRLVGSALDYGEGDSQRAFTELQTQPSLSVAQMLLKALTEISDVGDKLGEQNSLIGEVYRRKVAETTAASEVLGWEEPKSPDTMWMNPKSEMTGVKKPVGSRFFGAAAKQEARREKSNSPEQPIERAAAPEPSLYSPSEPAFIPPSWVPFPSLVPRINEPALRLPSRDTSTTSRRGSIPYTHRITVPETQGEWRTKAMGRSQQEIYRQRMLHAAFQRNLSQMKHDASSESSAPGPSTTSGEPLSNTGADNDEDTEDEVTEACRRPVTPIGPGPNLPEYAMTSFDAPSRSSRSSSNTLEGDPVQVEGPMDWNAGSSEYDYIP